MQRTRSSQWLPSSARETLPPQLVMHVRYTHPRVSFGAELGRPQVCLMLHKSHIVKRFPSRCFVIKSAGLTVPRIVSIRSPLFLFLLQPEVRFTHVSDGATPTAESQTSCCCSISPASHVSLVGSRIVLASPMFSLAQRTLVCSLRCTMTAQSGSRTRTQSQGSKTDTERT